MCQVVENPKTLNPKGVPYVVPQHSLGFRLQGLGLGFRVSGLRFRVEGSEGCAAASWGFEWALRRLDLQARGCRYFAKTPLRLQGTLLEV